LVLRATEVFATELALEDQQIVSVAVVESVFVLFSKRRRTCSIVGVLDARPSDNEQSKSIFFSAILCCNALSNRSLGLSSSHALDADALSLHPPEVPETLPKFTYLT